ncbi:MAG: DNA polymerase III subunit beta [Vampirovibrionales bacterium]|nr:DNA polymerase III subunit beta [Vampirovibrionales bacterium]
MSSAILDATNPNEATQAEAMGQPIKISLERDALFQAVSAVSRATASRPIQPILSHVLMEINPTEQRLMLSATDLDFSMRTWVALENSLTPPPAVKLTLSAKKLSEILAKLPAGSALTLTYEPQLQQAKIECDASAFELRTMPADEFPEITTLESAVEAGRTESLQVSLGAFSKAIAQTVFAAASYDTNNVLGGVFFRIGPSGLELVSTDGSRLARRIEPIGYEDADEVDSANPIIPPTTTTSAIIPAKTLQEFSKIAGSSPDKQARVQIAIIDGQIYLLSERAEIISRLIDGQYPKFEQLIPAQNQIVASASRQAFIASLERAAIMANERTNVVKLHFEANRLSLMANNPELGDSKDEMDVRYEGAALDIAFNYKYVIDALRAIDTERVRLETNGALAPAVFRGELENAEADARYLCLVMPVQVK